MLDYLGNIDQRVQLSMDRWNNAIPLAATYGIDFIQTLERYGLARS